MSRVAVARQTLGAMLAVAGPSLCSLSYSSGCEPSMKEIGRDELKKHKTLETGIWVTYKVHPGGMEKVLLAAGGSLEPFWKLYAFHMEDDVLEILNEHKIGVLKKEDVKVEDNADPYALDPARHPALKVNTVTPFNAETPLQILVDSPVTPNDLFYVRNHLPVPHVDPKCFRLEIVNRAGKTVAFSLEDIKSKFKKHSVTVAIQCAGNRRSEMTEVRPVKGLNWTNGAIGNTTWAGARLTDVLEYCGISEDEEGVEHIQFEGLDRNPSTFYGASIPKDTAFDPKREVLIAYEMGGEEIPLDHGYPLRAIVPGVVGARQVKWLTKIVASDEESQSHWQRKDYKGFGPNVDWDTVNFDDAPSIQEMPVQSAICSPMPGARISKNEGELEIKGYAIGSGGNRIVRVDVSVDGGKTWKQAELQDGGNGNRKTRAWAWTLWKIDVEIPEDAKEFDIVCKAVDAHYNTQPENPDGIWNLRGVLSTAWNKVKVEII